MSGKERVKRTSRVSPAMGKVKVREAADHVGTEGEGAR